MAAHHRFPQQEVAHPLRDNDIHLKELRQGNKQHSYARSLRFGVVLQRRTTCRVMSLREMQPIKVASVSTCTNNILVRFLTTLRILQLYLAAISSLLALAGIYLLRKINGLNRSLDNLYRVSQLQPCSIQKLVSHHTISSQSLSMSIITKVAHKIVECPHAFPSPHSVGFLRQSFYSEPCVKAQGHRAYTQSKSSLQELLPKL